MGQFLVGQGRTEARTLTSSPFETEVEDTVEAKSSNHPILKIEGGWAWWSGGEREKVDSSWHQSLFLPQGCWQVSEVPLASASTHHHAF